MTTIKLPTDRTVFQNAWVVDDCEKACLKWAKEMGVGPFFVTEYGPQFTQMTYRGAPAELGMIVGIAQAGNVQIEIIQPTVERCAYRDSVPAGTSGFHHICVWTHDIEADTDYFEKLGYPAANLGAVGDVRFAYYDTRPLMNCMLEVVSWNAATAERFAEIARAAEHWDGKDPIR